MHIALFGGRFDPPHLGHESITHYILEKYPTIDQVWYLPAKTHPWRAITASSQHRLTMLNFLKKENVLVSDEEISKNEDTYTIDTIRNLQETTAHTYIWICGSDQLQDLAKWKSHEELLQRISFLVIPRKGYQIPPVANKSYILDKTFPPVDYASTIIRKRIKKGLSINHLVSEEVEKYIIKEKLYK